MLADAAAAANHRQQPARLGILLPPDAGAKPYAALGHAVAKARFLLPRVLSGAGVVVARVAALTSFAAIVARSAAALAGIENVFRRGQPRAINPGQRRSDL